MEVVDLFVGQEFKESDVCFEMCKKKNMGHVWRDLKLFKRDFIGTLKSIHNALELDVK